MSIEKPKVNRSLNGAFKSTGVRLSLRPKAAALSAAGLFAFSALCSNSWAILIGFESSEGYSLGNLASQPNSGTQWVGNSSAITYAPLQVTSGQGVGGGNGLQVQSTAATGSTYRYTPSSADLGGAFSASSSVLSLSFDLRWDSINTSSTGIGRFYIGAPTIGGTPTVLSLDWYSNGRIGFNTGTFQYATTSSGGTFVATAGVFYSITATLDYSTDTYVLTVNSVTQSQNSSTNLSFRSPAGSLNDSIDLTTINNQTATFQNWTIDNINYAAVPEPSSLALLSCATLGIGLVRLRRRLA